MSALDSNEQSLSQVVVKAGKLLYLCEPVDFSEGWLCGACKGIIRPRIRHKCHNCGAMVIEVRVEHG